MKKKEANVAKAKKASVQKKSAQKTSGKKAAPKKTVAKKAASKKAAAKKAAPKKSGALKSKAGPKAPLKKADSKAKAGTKAATKTKTKTKASSSAIQGKSINWENFITPLDDRLIVQVSSGEKMTPGGLYIPDTVADVSGNRKGTVLVSGQGHRDSKGKMHLMEVQAGDVVVFSEFSGTKMSLLDQEVHILRESEILGIVE